MVTGGIDGGEVGGADIAGQMAFLAFKADAEGFEAVPLGGNAESGFQVA